MKDQGVFTAEARRVLRASAVILCLAVGRLAFGATIYLKDGRKVEGDIVEKTDTEVRVRLKSGKTETIRRSDIKSIDEPPPPRPKVVTNETGDEPVDLRTREYVRWLDMPLATVTTPLIVVRGDHEVADLKRIADACEKCARHFLKVFGCEPTDVLKDRYGPARIEVFQFFHEEQYLAFCDKVLARIRDDTVDDARLAFMRRQRGFWIAQPRVLLAQYLGPSDLVTSISAAVHKVSHEMLTAWKPSGSFMPWWFYEGFGVWQEFAVLGETRTYCIEIARPTDYARPGTPEADEEAKARTAADWRAKVKARVAARREDDFPALARKSLNELVFEDVQEAWSIVDWLDRQGKLRDFGTAYKEARDLGEAFKRTLGVPSEPAYQMWRDWVMKTY